MKLSLAKINFFKYTNNCTFVYNKRGILEVYTSYKNFDKQVERMQKRYISDKKNAF